MKQIIYIVPIIIFAFQWCNSNALHPIKGCRIRFNGFKTINRSKYETLFYLSCPPQTEFQWTPERVYQCNLTTGVLTPSKVPQCVFKNDEPSLDCGLLVPLPCAPEEGQWGCGGKELIPKSEDCVEGCYCPEGTVYHEDKCITEDQCPCEYKGKMFNAGEKYTEDCQNCVCKNGGWECSNSMEKGCIAECYATGDPHYTTFDGVKYDFMGQCYYTLLKTNNLIIEIEQWPWNGKFHKPSEHNSNWKTGIKGVTIKSNRVVTVLDQNKVVKVNGEYIKKLPVDIRGINIRYGASDTVFVTLPDSVLIKYSNGIDLTVILPTTYQNKTQGLCGVYNKNPKDDFTSPDGTIQQNAVIFANTWKKWGHCKDLNPDNVLHPCEKSEEIEKNALKYCDIIKSKIFEECHKVVTLESFFDNCMYDGCECASNKVSECFCPMISVYSKACANAGVIINWMESVPECQVKCPEGQIYQVCGNSCARTCSDISSRPNCKEKCVEGCNCPKGTYLDDEEYCVPISQCSCQKDGIKFPPGYKETRKGKEMCICENAKWSCRTATKEELLKYPDIDALRAFCNKFPNMELTSCMPEVNRTCENMHMYEPGSPGNCYHGCKCKNGYVWHNQKCVLPEQCPCELGGKSYKEGYEQQKECNTCTCKEEKWSCTTKQCTSECTAWSGSHYKTFDGKLFDFIGVCSYILAKGKITEHEYFEIIIENVECGVTSCLNSVNIRLVNNSTIESVRLTSSKPLPKENKLPKRFTARKADLLYIVEVLDLDMSIYWDGFRRVFIKIDTKWRNKMTGLCGNFNGNITDDFILPTGNMTTILNYANFWKYEEHCPTATKLTDSCENNPDQIDWTLEKCSFLKSEIFAPCHSKVPVETYYKNCVHDLCASDGKHSHESACAILAAYAQDCSSKGEPIKWRSQHLCPIQCDEDSYYSSCIPSCPSSCDKEAETSRMCEKNSCIEGCFRKTDANNNCKK